MPSLTVSGRVQPTSIDNSEYDLDTFGGEPRRFTPPSSLPRRGEAGECEGVRERSDAGPGMVPTSEALTDRLFFASVGIVHRSDPMGSPR